LRGKFPVIRASLSQYLHLSIVYSACIIGSTWHLYDVSHVYLQYRTSITVISEIPESMKIPTLTICTRNLRWLSRGKLFENYPMVMNTTMVLNLLEKGQR